MSKICQKKKKLEKHKLRETYTLSYNKRPHKITLDEQYHKYISLIRS